MKSPSWFLDELAFAGAEHLDDNYVPTYDEKAQTDPSPDIAVLQKFGLDSTHAVIDMGAGTGTLSLAVAPLCQRVIAVDVSPVMLAQLQKKIAQSGMQNIETVQAGFLSYDHQGDLADFVYSRHALHHLPDFWKVIALKRIASTLKQGGVFFLRDLIYSCNPGEIEQVLQNWLDNATDDPSVGWTRAELETHIRDEYSPFSWLVTLKSDGTVCEHSRPCMDRFTVHARRVIPVRTSSTSVTVAARLPVLHFRDMLPALERAISWQSHEDRR